MTKVKTIRREGGSRVMVVTDIIPIGWQAVVLVKAKQKNGLVTVILEKVK